MSDPESVILSALSPTPSNPSPTITDTYAFSIAHNLDHNQVVGVSKSLEVDAYVALQELSTSFYVLNEEAKEIVDNGSQEVRVLKALIAAAGGGMAMPDLQAAVGKDICKIGMGNCLKNKWAKKEKDGKLVAVVTLEDVKDETREHLQRVSEQGGDEMALDVKVRLLSGFSLSPMF